MTSEKTTKRLKRHGKIRAKLSGTSKRPRLIVFRSLNANYVQLIDDSKGVTLCAASDLKIKEGTKIEKAKQIGLEIGKLAVDQGIKECVFDRNGYKYHGRVKAIAEGARESGLKF